MSRFKGWTNSVQKPNATKPKGESANQITRNIIRVINMQPKCVAYRINNVGIWDQEKKVYRKGNTQRGIFDISATIKGRAVWLEVKSGRDKISDEQLIFQQEIRLAGGIAEFIYSTDQFLEMLPRLLENKKNEYDKRIDS